MKIVDTEEVGVDLQKDAKSLKRKDIVEEAILTVVTGIISLEGIDLHKESTTKRSIRVNIIIIALQRSLTSD